MRKFVLVAGLLAGMFTTAAAQDATNKTKRNYFSLGPVLGYGHSWIGQTEGKKLFNSTGYLGLGMVYSRFAHWGFGADLVVSSEGQRARYNLGGTDYKATNDALYIRLPLKAIYFFGEYGDRIRPKVYAGPSLGFKVNEMHDADDDILKPTGNIFNTFDLGVQAGAGANFRVSRRAWLNADISYYQGVLDAIDDGNGDYNTNQNIRLNLGLLFAL
jgi:outer membrane protein W